MALGANFATINHLGYVTMVHVVQIDGSQGEGGGQIVRSSVALSMVIGLPVSIENVRAGRERPGLMRQHLTSVQAAQQICRASVTGDSIGSRALTFHPGQVVPGDYQFAIGTAGSATLVLQTVLPPLLLAGGPSRLILEGGTHNPLAPSFDFLNLAFVPLVNRLGPRVTTTDQLMLPLGIAVWQSRGTSGHRPARFRTTRLTNHSKTHIDVLKTVLGIDVTAEEQGELVTVTLQ